MNQTLRGTEVRGGASGPRMPGFLQWPQNANPWTGPRGAPLGQGWALLGLGLSTAKAECSAAAAGLNSAAFLPRLPGLSPWPWCQVAWLRYLWGTGDPL